MWSLEECCKEILCLDLQKPVRAQQQQHLSILSFVRIISTPFHLRCCRINCTKCPGIHKAVCIGNTHISATNSMGLEQIFTAGGNDKKEPKPKTLVTFMIERSWALKGFAPSWKKVLLSGSAEKWLRRNVWTCGPFGPTYPVKGAELHKLATSTLGYPNTRGKVVILVQIGWDHGGFLAGSLSKWLAHHQPL